MFTEDNIVNVCLDGSNVEVRGEIFQIKNKDASRRGERLRIQVERKRLCGTIKNDN